MDYFKEGFKYANSQLSSILGSVAAEHYTGTVKQEIDGLMFKLREEAERRPGLDDDRLQGFMAEVFHTHTLRINAAVKGQTSTVSMPESTELGSADIMVDGKSYSSKYYKGAAESVRQQATTIESRYQIAKNRAEARGDNFMTREEYMKKFFPDAKSSQESIYYSQGRLIPSDQLEKAKDLLEKKIAKEQALGRIEKVAMLQEVRDSLTDTVSDGKGNCSIRLKREASQKLTRAVKDGELEEILNEMGISLKNLIKPQDIMREAFQAGLSAATLSFVLNVAPVIIDTISILVQEGHIDVEKLKKQGFEVLTQTAKSFLLGSISASVTIAAKAGYLGTSLVSADPTVIGALVVYTFTAIENGIKVACGKMSKQEYAQTMMRTAFVSAASIGFGTLAQSIFAQIPVVPYLLGSFIGSAVGGFLYQVTEKVFLSYCVESGCVFFGLVKQDYEIDESLLEKIGLSVYKEEAIELHPFVAEKFEVEAFNYSGFEYEHSGVSLIRRGVIGVFSIGYY